MSEGQRHHDWMDAREGAEELRVRLSDLRAAVAAGTVPALVINGHLRFSRIALREAAGRPARMLGKQDDHEDRDDPVGAAASAAAAEVTHPAAVIPAPRGLTWEQSLSPGGPYTARWPTRRDASPDEGLEPYGEVWRGRIRLDADSFGVTVGIGTRNGRPRMTVWLDQYPTAEFIGTDPAVQQGGWASLIKPDGSGTLAVGAPPPPLYANCRLMLYRSARGGGGSGVPRGMGVIVGSGDPDTDRRSAVHHAVARRLAKQGIAAVPA
jgi:hypothetical protein